MGKELNKLAEKHGSAFAITEYFGGPEKRERLFTDAREFAAATGMQYSEHVGADGRPFAMLMQGEVDLPIDRDAIDWDASTKWARDFMRFCAANRTLPTQEA